MTWPIIYGLVIKKTKEILEGMGILKGSPCQVKSVTPVPSPLDPDKPVTQILTLKWDSSTTGSLTPNWQETQIEIVDNARQIYEIKEDPSKRSGSELWYDVTYYDGSAGHFTVPMSSSAMKRKVVTSLPLPELADLNTIYMIEDPLTPGSYQQYISTYDDDLKKYVWVSLGSTATDLTAYLKKIDDKVIYRTDYPNPDQETKVLYPTAATAPGAINEFQTMFGNSVKYDYTNSKITGLNTHTKTNVIGALNDMGNLEDLEMWDPATEKPATLVEAINHSNKTYSLETQTTVDRTKFTKVKKLKVDYHDGSPVVQIGDDIENDRVDIVKRDTPESSTSYVDYRTYDIKIENNLFDPNDTTQTPFGNIHIPKMQLKKEQVYDDVIDNIVPTFWTQTMPNDYETTVELSHVPNTALAEPIVQISPETGGSKHLVTTLGSKTAKIQILGATTEPEASKTTATISYKGESTSVAARYYLQIEGKDYSYSLSGDYIDIAKDSFLNDAGTATVTEDDKPYPGARVGDKYMWFDFMKADGTHKFVYIPLKDLIHDIIGIQAIKIELNSSTNKNEARLVLDPDSPKDTLTQSDNGLKIALAASGPDDTAQKGVVRFAIDTEVNAASSALAALRPIDVHTFVNESTSVKDDLGNFYKDTTTTEIVNNTTIKAINELATETITKRALADDKDVATYDYQRIPTTGATMPLGVIHDVEQVYQVDKLSTVVNPQAYEIYYLSTQEGSNFPGLYVYDVANAKWVTADGCAIIDVAKLPDPTTEIIDGTSLYRISDNRTLMSRYTLSPSAKLQGYYMDDVGLHCHTTTPWIDVTWASVKADWPEYLNDELVADADGALYALQDPITTDWELIYNYVSEDGSLWHFYKNAWRIVSIQNITTEDIKNLLPLLRF